MQELLRWVQNSSSFLPTKKSILHTCQLSEIHNHTRFPFDEAALLISLLYSPLKSLCIYSKANSCRTCLNVKSQAETYPREQPLQFCTLISKSFCHNIPNTFIKPTDLADCSISIFHDVNLRSILSRCCTGRSNFPDSQMTGQLLEDYRLQDYEGSIQNIFTQEEAEIQPSSIQFGSLYIFIY